MGERLAYQLLYEALASFGGGPNVNSRSTVSKGVNLYRVSRGEKVKADRMREYLARKSAWRESHFLAAFQPWSARGKGAQSRKGMVGGYPT